MPSEHARILAVADVHEALTAKRPYRSAMEPDAAAAVVRQEVELGRLCGDAAAALSTALGAPIPREAIAA